MNEKLLKPHQIKAIEAIKNALASNKKHITVEMAVGCGQSVVLAKTIEQLCQATEGKILVVTGSMFLKERIEMDISTSYQGFIQIDIQKIRVENEQRFFKDCDVEGSEYQNIIFYDTIISPKVCEILKCDEKTVITFAKGHSKTHAYIPFGEVVFSYGFEEAIQDGVLTPAMDASAFEPTIQMFSKQLLEQFGYTPFDLKTKENDGKWDLVASNNDQKVWVEWKAYKSQTASPTVSSSVLKNVVMKKMLQKIPPEDIVLLIVFSNVPSLQKDEIYQRYHIIVWDIENLVYYSKDNHALLKQLSQITYFPIDNIEGQPSLEAEAAQLLLAFPKGEHLQEAENVTNQATSLIQRLKDCDPGTTSSREYENICEDVLRYLFEANYFNRLTSQHKTTDKHFRMDLIGSLKISQNNDESMHPLWQMLVQHYNSHFVVFEFKNYTEKIDQNLIYITEKYLFDAALRNVAFIISRKGFSDAAKFAAEGCLKEHGKLILDVTQNDLIKMLESPEDNPADHLLEIMEDFLMGISK